LALPPFEPSRKPPTLPKRPSRNSRTRRVSAGSRSKSSSRAAASFLRNRGRVEHFGFLDGLTNPFFEGADDAKRGPTGNGKRNDEGGWSTIATGEFLLGYQNEKLEDNLEGLSEGLRELFENGTFAVFRQLEQRVFAFHDYVKAAGVPDLAQKMMGRTQDGVPLVSAERRSSLDNNDFDYRSDERGTACPLGAHIRRSNRRVDGQHRLIRRGMTYGDFVDPDRHEGPRVDGGRGLYFIALNASIENQFEFVQRSWINGPIGRLSDATDPIGASGSEKRRFAVEGRADESGHRPPALFLDIPEFVVCRGGEYYLMPGMAGLRRLTESAPTTVPATEVA
jgi:Dyp-type peroxidase family